MVQGRVTVSNWGLKTGVGFQDKVRLLNEGFKCGLGFHIGILSTGFQGEFQIRVLNLS